MNAIIQLQQTATQPTTTTPPQPVFHTKEECLQYLLLTFVDKTLVTNGEEREETRSTSVLTKAQEQICATEKETNWDINLIQIQFQSLISKFQNFQNSVIIVEPCANHISISHFLKKRENFQNSIPITNI